MALTTSEQTPKKPLILSPEKASIFDLLCCLITGNIEGKEFVYTIQKKEKLIEQKGIILLSLVVQKILQISSGLISCLGEFIDRWLNLVASDHSFSNLLLNLFQGNEPDKESVNFKSTLGCLDERMELDKNIKPEDNRYLAALSAMASKLAYENKALIKATVEDRWKMKLLCQDVQDFWNDDQEKSSTQGFMFQKKDSNHNMIIVAFRGTEPFSADSWRSDFDISFYKYQGVGKVHCGFMKALGLLKDETWLPKPGNPKSQETAYNKITNELKRVFEADDQTKFILTGHSLGGALAVLFPAVLELNKEDRILSRLEAVYTFGQPRVGDKKFGDFMMELFRRHGVKYYRFVYSHDLIPRVPLDNSTMLFKHFGKCVYYNSLYEGKIVEEVPEKNYFSVKSFISNRVDALWELKRSFLLPRMFGTYYQEGCPQRMFRILGLLVPGITAHSPPDYINAVQLGNDDIFD